VIWMVVISRFPQIFIRLDLRDEANVQNLVDPLQFFSNGPTAYSKLTLIELSKCTPVSIFKDFRGRHRQHR